MCTLVTLKVPGFMVRYCSQLLIIHYYFLYIWFDNWCCIIGRVNCNFFIWLCLVYLLLFYFYLILCSLIYVLFFFNPVLQRCFMSHILSCILLKQCPSTIFSDPVCMYAYVCTLFIFMFFCKTQLSSDHKKKCGMSEFLVNFCLTFESILRGGVIVW